MVIAEADGYPALAEVERVMTGVDWSLVVAGLDDNLQ